MLALINGSASGRIDDAFSDAELERCYKMLSAVREKYHSDKGQIFSGINEQHILYNWFCENIFSRIQEHAGQHVKLLFASLLDSHKPLEVHSDYYHKRLGEPYMAFLIPLQVNGESNDDAMAKSSTIIFEQQDTFVDHADHREKKSRGTKGMLDWPIIENNCINLSDTLLSHIDTEILKRLSLQNVLKWKSNSFLFWDERLLHCSNNYTAQGVETKQAIVMHSYMEEQA